MVIRYFRFMKYHNADIKAPYGIVIIFILSFQISFFGNCYGQNFTLKHGLRRDAISFIKVKNLIVIPIMINGKGPYNILLDSGVDPLIITDPSLIENFSEEGLRSFQINGAGEGEKMDVLLAKNVKVDIGKASIDNIPTFVLKKDIFNFSEYLGIKIHGIIGYYFFRDFLVKINYQNTKVIFSLPGVNKHIKGEKFTLVFFENKPYIRAKLTAGNLGEIDALLIVDTGASHALSLENYQNGVFPVPDLNISGNLGVGLSGIISGKIGRIESLIIGNFRLNNILTNFPNYADVAAKTNVKSRTGNLGADVLKRFHVTFDYKNSAMYLKKNSSFKDVFEHDMSGLEIFVTEKENRFFVNRIEVGSPAEKAGIEIGDEILSIDLKTLASSTLDDVTTTLKAIDGEILLIQVRRKNDVLMKLLKLKRRV